MTTRNVDSLTKVASAVPAKRRAAAYLRMSTDSQRYSIGNQLKAIREYAERNGIDVIKIYKDEGKSGLTIEERKALSDLFLDVIFGRNDFSEILVYDVSRWGRFQDLDESAHYEYLCRRNGVRVTYCEELFVDDGSANAALWKAILRAKAAEESRIKSARVSATLCHLASKGWHTGGLAPYGFVRVAIDQRGHRRQILAPGKQRSVRRDNVILMPGPRSHVRIVGLIFDLYVKEKMTASAIARRLNEMGVRSPSKQRWSMTSVMYVLSNEMYLGVKRYNRTSAKLKTKMLHNDEGKWITVRFLKKGIIDERVFAKAQRIRSARAKRRTDDQLISELKTAIEKNGPVSAPTWGSWFRLASRTTYIKRFGSLKHTYELAGIKEPQSVEQWDRALFVRQIRTQVLDEIKVHMERRGAIVEFSDLAHTFRIDGRVVGFLEVLARNTDAHGKPWWRMRMPEQRDAHLYVIGLLNSKLPMPFVYYAIPEREIPKQSFLLQRRNRSMERYRCSRLSVVEHVLERWRLAARASGPQGLPVAL